MKKGHACHQVGFSLIELLIFSSVAAVVGILLIAILVQNNGLIYQQSAKVDEGISLNNAVGTISNDIKSAALVANGYPQISPTILTSADTLVLEVPALDSGGNIIGNTYDFFAITKDLTSPQILREKIYPDPTSSRRSSDKVLVNNLSLIKFVYLDQNKNVVTPTSASKINLTLNATVKASLGNQQSSSSAEVNLRND